MSSQNIDKTLGNNYARQINNLINAKCVIENDGFLTFHFLNSNLLTFRRKQCTQVKSGVTLIIKKFKPQKKMKLSVEDFDLTIEEYGWLNQKLVPTPEIVQTMKRRYQRKEREYNDALLTKCVEYYDQVITKEGFNMTVEADYAEHLAIQHNKMMHALNGNIDTIEPMGIPLYIGGQEKHRKVSVLYSDLRTNKNITYEVIDQGQIEETIFTIYTFFKTDMRVNYETKYIIDNASLKTNEELVKELASKDSTIVLPFAVCRMLRREDSSTIILDNGFQFDVETEKIKINQENYQIEVTANIYDAIRTLYRDSATLEGVNKIRVVTYENLKKSTIWSNHKDYQPSKRCKILFKNEVKKLFGTSDVLDQLDGKNEGCYQFASILTLVPKNSLVFRFSGKNYVDKEINSDLYGRVLASVTNQIMTKEQLAETATILTQIQMSYVMLEYTYDCIFSLFYLLTAHNLQAIAKNKDFEFSTNDVWEEIFKLRPIIQTFRVEIKKSLKERPEMIKISKFNITLNSLKNLAEKFVAPISSLSLDELIKMYNAGILPALNNDIKPLKFNVIKYDQMIIKDEPELDQKELFIKMLVENNISHVDLSEVFKNTVAIAYETMKPTLLKEILLTLSKYRNDSMYQPGLNKLFFAEPTTIAKEKLFSTNISMHNIAFINKHLQPEKKLAAIMSSHFYAYSKVLGLRVNNNPFNTVEYIFKIARQRRQVAVIVSKNEPIPSTSTAILSDDEEEFEDANSDLTFMEKLKTPFQAVYNFGKNLYKGSEQLGNIENFVSDKFDEVVQSFKSSNMGRVAAQLEGANFESIRSSYKSIEMIIKGWLNDFLSKICDLFGVKYDLELEPWKLFSYYLLWVTTDCSMIKKYIIITLAIELGIADMFWKIIKSCYRAFMNLFRTTTVSDVEMDSFAFNDVISKLGTTTARLKQKNVEQIKEQRKHIEHMFPQENKEESWLDYVWRILKEGTPKVIGTFAIVLAGGLGLKVAQGRSKENIGETIINGARNLSFLALGLAAIPKIYSYVLSAIHWVVDEAKTYIYKDHETKNKFIQRVSTWLSKTMYAKGLTELKLVRSATACNEFFANYVEMMKIKEKFHMLSEESFIRTEFSKRVTLMNELLAVAKAASIILYGQHEVFHVQFMSSPGYGKTDLADQVMHMLKDELKILEEEAAKMVGIQKTHYSSGTYPMNDTLKHNDMYYGQNFGYNDDEKIFKNATEDSVVSKMMMLSGFPCISQQASLNDKGRMFELRVLVSNTNNPYTKIDNLINNDALNRRRNLFRVRLKKRYEIKDGSKSAVNDKQILEDGINRSKGEHLIIDWMDPLKEEVKEKCEGMSVKQMMELIKNLMQRQFQIEENRLYNKDPMKCFTRIAFENFIQSLVSHDIPVEKEKLEYSAKTLLDIQKKIDQSQLDEQKKKNAKRELNVYNDLIPWMDPEDDCINSFNSTDKVSYFGPHIEAVNYTLQITQVEGKSFYKLAPGESEMREGNIDFSKFRKYNLKTGGRDYPMLIYKRGENDDMASVLYWLVKFSGCLNDKDLEKEIKIAKAQQEQKGKYAIWRLKLSNIHNRTLRAVKEAAEWLMTKAIKWIGEPIFKGILMSFSVLVMFLSLRAIGSLLAPQTTTVSNPPGAKPMFMMPAAQPVRTKPVLSSTPMTEQEMKTYHVSQNEFRLDTSDESKLIKGATYKIQYPVGNRLIRGTIIGIEGNVFMGCSHTFEHLTQPTQIQIYDNKFETNPQFAVKEYSLLPKDIKKLDNKDISLVYIEGFRSVRAIKQHFVTEEDLRDDMQNFESGHVTGIMLRNNDFSKPKQAQWLSTGYCPFTQTRNYNRTIPSQDKVISFKSNTEIKPGDSGSLVMHDNPKIQHKFIGLIFAVDYNTHVAVVSQEEIDKVLKQFDVYKRITTTVHSCTPLDENHELYEVFKYPDEVYNGLYGNLGISQSSGFKKTVLNGCFAKSAQYAVEPAIQNLNDKRIPPGSRNPFYVSLNKTAGEKDPSFTHEEAEFMMKSLKAMYIRHTKFIHTYRTLDTREAIVGIKYRGSTPINTKTTPGLPYKLYTNKKGKTQFICFYPDTQTWGIDDIVYNDVASLEQSYSLGLVPRNEKLEFPKKELVKEEKIKNPKTRTVATGNMIHQIVYNKLFKHLYILFKNSWEYGEATPIALGVDPVQHFDLIAKHLRYHDYMVDFDVKAWEEKVNLRLLGMNTQVKLKLLETAYLARGQKFDRKNIAIAHGLAIDYTDTYVCFRDIMYRKRSGLLSGHPGTLMENSEIHVMIIYLICHRILMKTRPAWANEAFIAEHVRFILAADDIVIAVSPAARLYVTIEKIVEEYGRLGFELTAADKSDKIQAKTINEIQFLKQHFVEREDIFYPKPNWDIIIQLLSWIREDSILTAHEQTKINRENAFAFLWWRGREDYEDFRAEFNTLMHQHNFQWTYDYEDMARIIQQRQVEHAESQGMPNAMEDEEPFVGDGFFED